MDASLTNRMIYILIVKARCTSLLVSQLQWTIAHVIRTLLLRTLQRQWWTIWEQLSLICSGLRCRRKRWHSRDQFRYYFVFSPVCSPPRHLSSQYMLKLSALPYQRSSEVASLIWTKACRLSAPMLLTSPRTLISSFFHGPTAEVYRTALRAPGLKPTSSRISLTRISVITLTVVEEGKAHVKGEIFLMLEAAHTTKPEGCVLDDFRTNSKTRSVDK